MKKVNILMPLYNGEKYLREQLDSLVNQTYKNLHVYFRDDGSTDNTLAIMEEYCNKKFEGITFIKIDSEGKSLGYPDCFWELIQKCGDADYYSFCDQDDFWEPLKIESAVMELEKADNSKPAMCFCNFDYYDSNMNYIRKGISIEQKEFTLEKGLYYTFAPGFTQVVNKSLIDSLDTEYLKSKNIAHDLWCQWVSAALGSIVFNNTVLAKYRRHEAAVTSANQGKISSIKEWWKKEINGNQMKVWKNCLGYFFNHYGNRLSDKNEAKYTVFSTDKYFFKVFYPRMLRPTLGGEVALRILFLLKKC